MPTTPDPQSPDDAAEREAVRAKTGPLFALVRLEEFLSATLMLTVLGAVTLQIFSRYVLRSPFIWTDEVARFGVVWLTFMAAAFVAAHERQITVEFMDETLGERRVRYLRVFARLMVILSCGLIVFGSILPVEMAARRLSTAMRIPLSVLIIAAPVGFGLIGLHSFWSLIRLLRGEKVVDTTMIGAV